MENQKNLFKTMGRIFYYFSGVSFIAAFIPLIDIGDWGEGLEYTLLFVVFALVSLIFSFLFRLISSKTYENSGFFAKSFYYFSFICLASIIPVFFYLTINLVIELAYDSGNGRLGGISLYTIYHSLYILLVTSGIAFLAKIFAKYNMDLLGRLTKVEKIITVAILISLMVGCIEAMILFFTR